MVRVIAGSARRLQLKTLDGLETRPTQDIIKETLFNCIQTRINGAYFLDLFAGSGSIGIEALSRGAKQAVFVENNRKAAAIIEENLEHTHFTDCGKVIVSDALSALHRLSSSDRFDLVYIDPPYKEGLEERVLNHLSSSDILAEDALVIVEAKRDTDLSFVIDMGYTVIKEKLYKNNKHLFLSREIK